MHFNFFFRNFKTRLEDLESKLSEHIEANKQLLGSIRIKTKALEEEKEKNNQNENGYAYRKQDIKYPSNAPHQKVVPSEQSIGRNDDSRPIIPVLLFACNRLVSYLI